MKDLLHYSDLLRDVYEWKETFIEWYNCSSSFAYAKQRFIRWRKQGEKMNHAAVRSCLKTMENWQEEICHYHLLRFMNASVEGKNNKIKALQRRHYFTRDDVKYFV